MSVSGVTHLGADGSHPWQRGLAAGYPLAGDLSHGGFYSENITAGTNLSVSEAVLSWQADEPHLLTMLSPNLSEIGAGVAVVGDYVYYVIDCAQPSANRKPVAIASVIGESGNIESTRPVTPVFVSTIMPATPRSDGKIIHLVKPGETLWLIAISYGVKVAEIRQWNNLTESENIFPGNKLLIIKVNIPTPVPSDLPTKTVTTTPSLKPSAVETIVPTQVIQATQPPSPAIQSGSGLLVLGVILIAAILLAAAISGKRGEQ